jgi:ribosomal protein S18 acetylase RimI-like enzyme
VRARRGLGAELLAEVEARAESRDLLLLVSDFNEGAQRFYRRMGYQQIGAIPGYVLPDVSELIFRKVLHE